jgi:predicted RNA binding protein YcfA (HicA-like mRNA interferase family)
MIPPDAQRSKGSHAIYVSQPEAVAALVEQAAKSLKTSAAA